MPHKRRNKAETTTVDWDERCRLASVEGSSSTRREIVEHHLFLSEGNVRDFKFGRAMPRVGLGI
jgi:hypothetical protein